MEEIAIRLSGFGDDRHELEKVRRMSLNSFAFVMNRSGIHHAQGTWLTPVPNWGKADIYIRSAYIGATHLNVKTLCLGFLTTREATGYEIKKEFEEGFFSHFIEASYGSIYPALNQLATQGLVTVREEEQAGKPDKKVYAITAAGRDVLGKWLSVVPARDKYKSEFLFEMFLQQYLPAYHVVTAVETQLAHLRTDLENIRMCREKCVDPAMMAGGPDFVLGYGEAVLTAAVSYLEGKMVDLGVPQAPRAAAE